MATIRLDGNTYPCRDGETVLDALERYGVSVPFSCRSGICYICLLRRIAGEIPSEAQAGLRESLREQGYFLACKCAPRHDIEIARPRKADLFSRAVVRDKEFVAPDVCRVSLEPATSLYYRPGQFINLRRGDGLARSYSLASVPRLDTMLEIHVKRIPGGAVSPWILDELQVGEEIEFQGPLGTSYYVPGFVQQSLLLVGTGSGLAPLIGVARDALHSGHRGQIHLFHGSRYPQGLYRQEVLQALSEHHANFHYTRCVSGGEVPAGHVAGRASDVALAAHQDLAGWRVYLAGMPAMVYAAQAAAEGAGAKSWEIHADPFELSGGSLAGAVPPGTPWSAAEKRPKYPDPDPEIWAALSEGPLLAEILKDFYTRVFADPRLAPFFEGVTQQRAQEKQYSFLFQVFTGEKIYFGESPRQAHHWMVIPDELFDYREDLFADCLRRHGLSERLVQKWRGIHEMYRAEIVKTEPWPKIVSGKALPLEGFGEITLGIGTLCDVCHQEIDGGETVRYHLRLGKVYCRECTGTS